MSSLRARKDTIRRSFGNIKDIVPVPNLIEIQSRSFNDFVQLDYLPEERGLIGLEKVLRDIFPIDYNDKMSLEYVSYELGHWSCTCGKLTGIEIAINGLALDEKNWMFSPWKCTPFSKRLLAIKRVLIVYRVLVLNCQ